MALKRTAQRFRDALTRKIVFCGTETAHKDDDIGAGERSARNIDQVSAAITHNGLEAYFHPKTVQLLGEEERVRVMAEGSQQF
jgi:hypothetical protein